MKRVLTAAVAAALLLATADASRACVGKILQVGVISRGEERLLSRMFSVLVNERTGTSIKVREFDSFRESFAALEKSEVDVVIAFTGQGYAEVVQRRQAGTADEVLTEARRVFNERYNLIWLEPWGLTDDGQYVTGPGGQPLPTQAAPLVRKETLKEFPALARLINKMSGRLDAQKMAALLKKTEAGDVDRVTRDYLKSEKLI